MSSNLRIDLSRLDEHARADLSHCLERYEMFLSVLDQKSRSGSGIYAEASIRCLAYKGILLANFGVPEPIFHDLLRDLAFLKAIVEIWGEGKGQSRWRRLINKFRFSGTKELKDTINRVLSALEEQEPTARESFEKYCKDNEIRWASR